jgi:peptide/nickel transport system substrate-binding protein
MKRVALLFVATTIALIVVGATHPVTAQINQPLETSKPLELSTSSIEPVPHPILSDVRIRRAIAYCTNKDALIASVYPALTPEQRQELVMDTFVPKTNWAYTAPNTTYPYNPTVGQQLLDEAGWTLQSGAEYRSKDGKELVLILTTTTAPFRVTYLTVFEEQMKACGIRIIRNHQPASWWFGDSTGLQVRDFELGNFAWIIEDDEPGGYTLYACNQIPSPTNNWSGQNFMGWCNQEASDAIIQASDPRLPREQRKTFYATVINQFAEDIPSLPLFLRSNATVWEHIDFNLQTFRQDRELAASNADSVVFTDYSGNQHTITLPSGAITQPITLSYHPLVANANPLPANTQTAHAFRLSVSINGVPGDTFSFNQPITITLRYTDTNLANIFDENSLDLFYWDRASNSWKDAAETCPIAERYERLDADQNLFEVRVCHLSEFSLIGTKKSQVFLPMVMR